MKAMVAGHSCLDITPVFPLGPNTKLEPGKLVSVGKAEIRPGGAVSNTGLAMHLLGADVTLLTKVGDDFFGQMIARSYEGVKADLKVDPSGSTSYSVVIAQPNIDRIFLHCSGVNDTFAGADIADKDLEGIDLVHFGYPTLMRKMYQNDGRELSELMRRLKDHGKVTSLDLSAVDVNSEAGRLDWRKILSDTLPSVDLFLPSFEELCFMLNRPLYDRLSGNAEMCLSLHLTDIRDLADQCHLMGASLVLIKCGCAGIYYSCSPKSLFVSRLGLASDQWSGSGFVDSFVPAKIISAAGAGDTAIAAFLSALMEKHPLTDCVRLAAAAGAVCVEGRNALTRFRGLNDLKRKIDEGWPQQKLVRP